MVENRLPALVAAKFGGKDKVNIAEVQRSVGLTYATVHGWMKGDLERFDRKALDAWCKYLNCGVGDILVYRPDDQG